MELKMLYFGAISEITNCTEELVEVPINCQLSELEKILKIKYQALNDVSFKIAVNKNIINQNITLSNDNEIALLPPFSGG